MLSSANWPKTINRANNIQVLIKRRWLSAEPSVIRQDDQKADIIGEFAQRNGPKAAKGLMLGLPGDRQPDRQELLAAAAKTTLVRFALTECLRVEKAMTDRIELSPNDWVREQTERILEQGTTDGVEMFDRPVVLITVTGAKSGKQRYALLMRVEKDGRYAMVASNGGASAHRRGTSTSRPTRRSRCRMVRTLSPLPRVSCKGLSESSGGDWRWTPTPVTPYIRRRRPGRSRSSCWNSRSNHLAAGGLSLGPQLGTPIRCPQIHPGGPRAICLRRCRGRRYRANFAVPCGGGCGTRRMSPRIFARTSSWAPTRRSRIALSTRTGPIPRPPR